MSTPYATLQHYYIPPSTANQKFAIPVFGGVGYMATAKVNGSTQSCHVWRDGDYDGRVLMSKAYPQCNINSSCTNYASKY